MLAGSADGVCPAHKHPLKRDATMASISSLGIGSGLDLGKLVQGLVAAERDPTLARLARSEAVLQAKLSAFGGLKSTLSSLQTSLDTLSALGKGRTVSSSNKDLVSATVDKTAAAGNYAIAVTNLASSHALASPTYAAATDAVGTGTLSISLGGATATDFVLDGSNNSLQDVRDAINTADMGINAVIVNNGSAYQLLLSAEDTGVANSIEVSVTDDDGSLIDGSGLSQLSYDATQKNMSETVQALDAAISINGLAISSASNTLSDAIPGVTFTLKGETGAQTVNIKVAKDNKAVTSAVNAFVTSFNSLNQQIKDLSGYDPATQQGGLLLGDSTVSSIASQLRNVITRNSSDSSLQIKNLVELGMTTNASGELTVDSTKLTSAIDSNFEDVVSLLNEMGTGVEAQVAGYLADNGLLDSRTDGISARLDDIGVQRLRLDDRITGLQQRLTRQFSNLDAVLGQLQLTSSFLTQQLSSIPVPGQSRK